MMRMLRGMADELGRTVVLVVHDVNVASCYSDRIVAMREGQLVAEGPTAELMTPELLRKAFDVEAEVHELAGRRIGFAWSLTVRRDGCLPGGNGRSQDARGV